MTLRKPEILLCLLLFCCCSLLQAQINRLPARIPANGFITRAMLDAANGIAEEERFTANIRADEILGHYYTDTRSGIITGCYLTMPADYDFEHHILFEARVENGRLHILNSYRLLHGNYTCCWNSTCDGFRRIGDLFFVRYCTTGSAFCAGHTMFFRRVADLQEVNGVVSQMYSGEAEDMVSISSRLQRRGDTLFLNYKWFSYVWEDEDTPVPTDSAEFRVPFFFRNGQVTTPDSATMRQYWLDW